MPDSLADLQVRRAALARQFAELRDLRPGSITSTSGRCGKRTCHCHQPGQPGHGPNERLAYKVDGKTVTEWLPIPAAVGKAQREVGEFREFQKLSHASVEINAQICRLRPAEEPAVGAQEKRRPKRSGRKSREVDQLLRLVFQARSKSGHLDLEAIEMAVRSAMHQAGAAELTKLLQFPAPGAHQRFLPCAFGDQARYEELRSKPVLTAVGKRYGKALKKLDE